MIQNGKAVFVSRAAPFVDGSGWVRRNVPLHSAEFGKLLPCPNSDPFKRYGFISGLVDEDKNTHWDSVIETSPDVVKAIAAIKSTLQRGYGWVTLWGECGLAKTKMLKIAIAEYIREQRQPASYANMLDIINHMRSAYDTNNPNGESEKRLDLWSGLRVLAIDEFEKVNETDFATSKRFSLMDRRYEEACRMKSITLIATNKNPAMFDSYLFDRIRDGRFSVIQLRGKSVRPMMKY